MAKPYNAAPISICVIGGGPSALSLLNAFNKTLDDEPREIRITVFEQQDKVGGQWNQTWKVGADQHGIDVVTSMYRDLWSNGPKECLEYADYTFMEHAKKATGSFPPRQFLREYIMGRVAKFGLLERFDVRCNHIVLDVREIGTKRFEVLYKDLKNDVRKSETFTHVVVATGHFSVPNLVEFPGFAKFDGRILHSHNFRNAREFKGQNVLIIGASYSGEDIALQCWKFGAKSVTVSYRSNKTGFHWPDGVREVPLLKEVRKDSSALFVDGTVIEDVDAIILCTGYKYCFPFLPDALRLTAKKNALYVKDLFKGVVWSKNPNVLYMAMQDLYYSYTMFDLQAMFARDVILGKVQLPSLEAMEADIDLWMNRLSACADYHQDIAFQTAYLKDLWLSTADRRGYVNSADQLDCVDLFERWEDDKHTDIVTYRDQSHFESKMDGTKAVKLAVPWSKAFDDSNESFMKQCSL